MTDWNSDLPEVDKDADPERLEPWDTIAIMVLLIAVGFFWGMVWHCWLSPLFRR